MILERLVARLGFDLEGEEDLRRFNQGLDNAGRNVQAFAAGAAGMAAAVGAAAAAAGGAIFSFANQVSSELDDILKQSEVLTASFDELREWSFAAELAGGSASGMASSLRNLDRRLAEAARGTGRAKQVLDDYGLSAVDAEGNTLSAVEAMLEWADAFEHMTTQEQLDLARAVGLDDTVVRILQGGREEIEKTLAEFREFGAANEEAAEAAADFQDELTRLQWVWRAMRERMATNLMRPLEDWMRRIREWMRLNREVIDQNVELGLNFTLQGVEAVGRLAGAGARSVRWLSNELERLTGIGAVGQAGILATLFALTAPGRIARLMRMGGALTVIVAALDDIRAHAEGDASAIGEYLDEVARLRREGIEAGEILTGEEARGESVWSLALRDLQLYDEALTNVLRRAGIDIEAEPLSPFALGERFGERLRADLDAVIADIRERIEGFVDWLPSAWTFPDLAAPFRPVISILDDIIARVNQAVSAVRNFSLSGVAEFLGFGGSEAEAPRGGGLSIEAVEADGPRRRAVPTGEPVIPSPGDVALGLANAFGNAIRDLPILSGDASGMIPAVVGAPHPEGDTVEFLRGIQAGIEQISSGIDSFKPGDTHFHRNVDLDINAPVTFHQHGVTSPSSAADGQAIRGHIEESARRAADIAAQEPGLDAVDG